jgi:fluoride ion exporter CrcB/FEX
MLEGGYYSTAIIYIIGSVVLSLIGVIIGINLARFV